MSNGVVAVHAVNRNQIARSITTGMLAAVCLHALLLAVVHPGPVALSRFLTAAVPIFAAGACTWRAVRLPLRERPIWLWSAAGMYLWAIAHIVETVMRHPSAASVLTVDVSDFIYLAGTFPLLVALSTTRETESLRAVFALNLVQIGLALILSYSLLYRMALGPAAASTAMARVYGAACILLALMSVLRISTWASAEERRSTRTLSAVLWTYMVVEIAMDYATARWNLRAGTMLDLVWSIPFFVGGWRAVHLPIESSDRAEFAPASRVRLIVEALCPMLITAGIFMLAAAVTQQHPLLGLSSLFVLLAIQAVQAAVVQVNYLAGRNLLLEREHDLQEINATLRRMSLEDALTHIANRRRFEAALQVAWRRGARKRQPLALLMIDVDYFKGVNDQHGHGYGDECLVTIARMLNEHARRPDDIVARLGGEEFVMLLPDTEAAGAEAVAARLLDAVCCLGIENRASPFGGKLTVSIGVGAVNEPSHGVDPAVLVDCADQALYDAKHSGRNRTCTRRLD